MVWVQIIIKTNMNQATIDIWTFLFLSTVIMGASISLNDNHSHSFIYDSFSEQNSYTLTTATLITTETNYVPATSYMYNNTANFTFHIPNVNQDSITYSLGNQSIYIRGYSVKTFESSVSYITYIKEKLYFSIIYLNSNITEADIQTSYINDEYTIIIPRYYTNLDENTEKVNHTKFSGLVETIYHSVIETLQQMTYKPQKTTTGCECNTTVCIC